VISRSPARVVGRAATPAHDQPSSGREVSCQDLQLPDCGRWSMSGANDHLLVRVTTATAAADRMIEGRLRTAHAGAACLRASQERNQTKTISLCANLGTERAAFHPSGLALRSKHSIAGTASALSLTTAH
jgi:hypothetical protein